MEGDLRMRSELERIDGEIQDIFRALSNGFQKLDKIRDATRQSKHLEELTGKMRECKRSVKEFDRVLKEEEGKNTPHINRQLNDKKQSMIEELNSYMALQKTYTSSLGNKRIELFDGGSQPVAKENIPMASNTGYEDKVHLPRLKWRKIAYGGVQPGYDDNYTDGSFLEDMVMNANVVKRDIFKVMLDSISISQYLSIVAIVACVWTYTLRYVIDEICLLALDITLLILGFLVLFLTARRLSLALVTHYLLNIFFFISCLYAIAPIYYTLTRSISSDSIWALTVLLLIIHLFLHDYSGSTIRPPGALNNPTLISNISLNSSIVASVLIASRLPTSLHVFAVMLFSLQVFLFAPLVTYCMKRYPKLHLFLSFVLMTLALGIIFHLHKLLCVLFLCLLIFVTVLCPFWLIRLQEYKFEINGPWDEAKLCFDIMD